MGAEWRCVIAANVMAPALFVTLCDRLGVAASLPDARAQDVRGGIEQESMLNGLCWLWSGN